MKNWQELNLWQKLVFGALVLLAAMLSPELMLFIDVGGIELAFGFLVLYYKALIAWFELQLNRFKNFIKTWHTVLIHSALGRPRVLSFHAVYCALVFFVTGSLVFSLSFLAPASLLNGQYW